MPQAVKRVAVTGAAGQIGYALLPRIAAGAIFGPDTPVQIQCLEIPPAMNAVRGVGMEMLDAAFPLLAGFTASDDPREAFAGADLALLVGSKPRGKGMERKDLIRENGPIFTGQGNALSDVADPDCRVVVVGNPCNTNCLIAQKNAPKLKPENFTAMTQLDHNRAVAQLAEKAGAHNTDVDGVIIWGNHSNKQYPDYHHATIGGKPALDVIGDEAWLQGEFMQDGAGTRQGDHRGAWREQRDVGRERGARPRAHALPGHARRQVDQHGRAERRQLRRSRGTALQLPGALPRRRHLRNRAGPGDRRLRPRGLPAQHRRVARGTRNRRRPARLSAGASTSTEEGES